MVTTFAKNSWEARTWEMMTIMITIMIQTILILTGMMTGTGDPA